MSHDAPASHKSYSPKSVRCAVLTVSDTRTLETDSSGDAIESALRVARHEVALRAIVPDELEPIRDWVARAIARSDVDAVLVTGGTGVSPRDGTIEAVEPLLQKVLTGFGELFRALSFQEIGSAAMLSRALAGTTGQTVVFVMPGSRGAVSLAVERLILPELGHLVGQLRRSRSPAPH